MKNNNFILKYFFDWPGIEFVGGCVCVYFTNTTLKNEELKKNALSYPSVAALMLNAIIVECNNLGSELSFAQQLEHTNSHQVWVVAKQQLIPSWKSSQGCLGWVLTAPALLPPIQVTSTAKGKLQRAPLFIQKAAWGYRFEGLHI